MRELNASVENVVLPSSQIDVLHHMTNHVDVAWPIMQSAEEVDKLLTA